LSNIRRKLGFLKEDGDDFEDLVDASPSPVVTQT
jgi:hypothetical protein